jgi:glutamyl endopeptidase
MLSGSSTSNFEMRSDPENMSADHPVLSGSLGLGWTRTTPQGLRFPKVTESVILNDDRTTELFTQSMPERLICSLLIRSRGQLYHGTGWLAAPNLVLTCGHNLYHRKFGGWAELVEIVPGLSDNARPFGSYKATRFSAHTRWVANLDQACDIGCLHLDVPLGSHLGWFGVAQINAPLELVGHGVVCAGYPEYQGDFIRQRRGVGEIVAAAGSHVFHTVDTNDGQSGAPIWLQNDPALPPTALAVHTYEKIMLPGSPPKEANSGTLITSEMHALIGQWAAAIPMS